MSESSTFLCISCYFKGVDFLMACKEAGNIVYLVTSSSLRDEPWPHESLDEIFYVDEDEEGQWNNEHLVEGLAFFMQSNKIDRIIALDDFDVERAAMLREQFRIPGMGQTTARYFRDKLAMRIKAREGGMKVPAFTSLFNDDDVTSFIQEEPPPWILKPRSEASATGIRKIQNTDELWQALQELGVERHRYLLETFVTGDVFHVDSISYQGKNIFTRSSQYLNPPFEVAHQGGIFRTRTLSVESKYHHRLEEINQKLMQVFGMQHSASHSEYIRHQEDDDFYFLETSSRVGGAHIAEMIEAASGINLWKAWAQLESAQNQNKIFSLPDPEISNAAAIISLSKFEHPDTSAFDDPEIWWRMEKEYHIGFILRSDDEGRLRDLLDEYAERIASGFHASAPAPKRSSH